MLGVQAKASICTTTKENLPLYLLGLSHKETPLVIEIINFAIKSLVFQNRFLNGACFILDIKLLWKHLLNKKRHGDLSMKS